MQTKRSAVPLKEATNGLGPPRATKTRTTSVPSLPGIAEHHSRPPSSGGLRKLKQHLAQVQAGGHGVRLSMVPEEDEEDLEEEEEGKVENGAAIQR